MEDLFKENWKFYYDLGLMPFPASQKGKNPIVPWKDVQPSLSILTKWEDHHSNSNIWVRLGDRFDVIDPDGPGAEEFVQSLNLPPCPTSCSGHKSKHRWFRVSFSIKPLKVQNGDGTFLELRTGNMGMLVPPSFHPETGKAYRWLEGHSPNEFPF